MPSPDSQPHSRRRTLLCTTLFGPFWLPNRLCLLAAVLTAELLALTRAIYPLGPYVAGPMLLLLALLVLGRDRMRSLNLAPPRFRHSLLATHGVLLAAALIAEILLLPRAVTPAVTALLALTLTTLAATLTAAMLSREAARRALAILLTRLPIAALVTLLCLAARRLLLYLWDTPNSPPGRALQSATFAGAAWILRRFYSFIYTRTSDHVLGTRGFGVRITASCSGVESIGLMLVLGTAWLLYTRREIRLARAFLLLPLALLVTWFLNVLRIAALIALGDSGHPHFALTVYHSHAGWLLFNAAALSFVFLTRKLPWVQRHPSGLEARS